jgi:predicted GNAT superfamily acetyltransferase
MTTGFEIRIVHTAAEMAPIVTVFQQVWGTTTPIVNVELLRAISHAGGYVSTVYEHDRLMGASFGFLARHNGQEALHSHVTGILPGVQHAGAGRAVKLHQRDWAADRGIPWITWTFDPLVRRNAWFNIEVLGAHVSEYLVDFYGPMTDSINSHDVRPADGGLADRLPEPPCCLGERRSSPTPADIVVLRRTDPGQAMEWRHRVRSELGDRLMAGAVVTGFTREGCYTLELGSAEIN